jgi:hypothetical protein
MPFMGVFLLSGSALNRYLNGACGVNQASATTWGSSIVCRPTHVPCPAAQCRTAQIKVALTSNHVNGEKNKFLSINIYKPI